MLVNATTVDLNINTRKVAPTFDQANTTLNNTSYVKGATSTINTSFINPDSTVITNILVNDLPLNASSGSTLTDLLIEQTVGSTPANNLEYIISGFTYNDGVNNYDIILSANQIRTLDYAILKDTPTALISNLVANDYNVIFDATVIDPDSAITSGSVTANIYEAADLSTIVTSAPISDSGAVDINLVGLDENTNYVAVINADYDTYDRVAHINESLQQSQTFMTILANDIMIDNLTLSSTDNSITIIDAIFSSGGINNIISGEIVLTNLDNLTTSIIALTTQQIVEIKSGAIVTPIILNSNIVPTTNYKITFNFISASAANMVVTQAINNTVLTRDVPPIFVSTSATINKQEFDKNDNSVITVDFVNTDNIPIDSLVINDNQVLVDPLSTTTDVTITQNVGNIGNNFEYVITGFTYYDNTEIQVVVLPVADQVTFAYTIPKDVPVGSITNLIPSGDDVSFDVVITDPDLAIISGTLKVELSNTNTGALIRSIPIPDSGGTDIVVTGLPSSTPMMITIIGNFDTLVGAPVLN